MGRIARAALGAALTCTGMVSVGATAANAVVPYNCTTEQSLSTQVARVGQTVTAVLSCFDAGELVTGSFFSSPTQVFSVTADANGAATVPFVVPATTCGLHTVVANGQTSHKQAATAMRIIGCGGGHHSHHHGRQTCRDWRDPEFWIENCDTEDHGWEDGFDDGWDPGFDAAYSSPLAAQHTTHHASVGAAGLGLVAPVLFVGGVVIARRRKRA